MRQECSCAHLWFGVKSEVVLSKDQKQILFFSFDPQVNPLQHLTFFGMWPEKVLKYFSMYYFTSNYKYQGFNCWHGTDALSMCRKMATKLLRTLSLSAHFHSLKWFVKLEKSHSKCFINPCLSIWCYTPHIRCASLTISLILPPFITISWARTG